ncbi:hypothetical protein D3C84_1250290 [compost metagenome]
MRSSRVLMACGNLSSKTPNIAKANTAKNIANGTSTQADCRRACRFSCAPNIPINAPSRAKHTAIGST